MIPIDVIMDITVLAAAIVFLLVFGRWLGCVLRTVYFVIIIILVLITALDVFNLLLIPLIPTDVDFFGSFM